VYKIRKAELKDIEQIRSIYNKAILKTIATFDIEKKDLTEMKKWFKSHGPKNPIIVAEIGKEIVGWASLSSYSTRCAYSDTAELSLYVKKEYQGKGIGNKLMRTIIEEGEKAGLHTIISRIADGNKISVKLHEKYGFFYVGVLKEVGKKFGKIIDVHLMEKVYK